MVGQQAEQALRAWKTLEDEKKAVKRAMDTIPIEGTVWQPIALGWFLKWKTYVNFDDEVPEPRDQEVILKSFVN